MHDVPTPPALMEEVLNVAHLSYALYFLMPRILSRDMHFFSHTVDGAPTGLQNQDDVYEYNKKTSNMSSALSCVKSSVIHAPSHRYLAASMLLCHRGIAP